MKMKTYSLSVLTLAALLGGCASYGVKNPSGTSVTELAPAERGTARVRTESE